MSGWAQRAAERAEDEARDTRCHACDRRLATAADYLTEACPVCDAGDPCPPHDALCWSSFGTRCTAIDWRGRALAAEAEVARLTAALRFLCRADVGPCDFCGATATKRDPSDPLAWWCDVCAPPDAVDHEHAATLRPLLPPRGAK